MGSRVTLKAYLKTDLWAAFPVFGFLIVFLCLFVVIMTDAVGGDASELVFALTFSSVPLILSLLALLDAALMVRAINRAIESQRWVRGEVAEITNQGDVACMLTIFTGAEARVRRAFVFAGERARFAVEGSAVMIARPSIGWFRNPIPLQLLLDGATLSNLTDEDELVWKDSGLSVRVHRLRLWLLAILFSFGVTLVTLISPLIFWAFPSIKGFYWLLSISCAALVCFWIWYRDGVEVLADGVRALSGVDGPRVVKWEEILQVDEKSDLGLRYLDIQTGDAEQEMWIPMSMNDLDGLLADIVRTAPEGNPLRRVAQDLLAVGS